MGSRKFLIIRFSSIGDIVLTSPVVRNLKQCYPDCEIHFLTKAQYREILESNPYITKVHLLGKSLIETVQRLKTLDFDDIIDLHSNLRTFIIKRMLGIPAHAFNKLNIRKWLRVRLGLDVLPSVHVVDRYMDTLHYLEISNDGKGLDYFIPSDTTLPETLHSPYIAIAFGAAHATKCIPETKLKEILEFCTKPIVFIGGSSEAAVADRLVEAYPNLGCVNWCGKLSLHQSALVIQSASSMITSDTGMMHIAAAFHKKIISVWGNTIPAFGMYPYYGSQPSHEFRFEQQDLPCRPCSKIGFDACPKQHFKCMMEQESARIALAACAD